MLRIYTYILTIIIVTPLLITFPAALTTTKYLTFPPIGFTFKWFIGLMQDEILIESLMRSLLLAIIVSFISILIALPLSFAFERYKLPRKNFIETFFMGPRMIPQIIFVLGLLIFYTKLGIVETYLGLVISHLVIGIPLAFRTLSVSVNSLDKRLEWSAQILGANNLQILIKIIFPQIKTGLIASFIFTFILSFNNVTMALFLTSIGKRTLPIEMFNRMYISGIGPEIPAISFLLSIVGLIIFIVADRTVGVYKYMSGGEI
ncbi:hypothetical protein ES708_18616 [subsurface metagenome]